MSKIILNENNGGCQCVDIMSTTFTKKLQIHVCYIQSCFHTMQSHGIHFILNLINTKYITLEQKLGAKMYSTLLIQFPKHFESVKFLQLSCPYKKCIIAFYTLKTFLYIVFQFNEL